MRKIIAASAILLALTASADAGLSKGPRAPRVLNSQTLSGLCVGLPHRDENAQQAADYYQAYNDGMCMMFVTFGIEVTRGEGSVAANYCLPADVKYGAIAHDFAILLRRNREARETDPLDVLINMMEVKYPCEAK
jgi:hypothetical protein